MKLWKSRAVVYVALFSLVMTSVGCGYFMHPERRTDKLSTAKDTDTIVYDCLWLLAGVVPGVVALVVDMVSDTWYLTESELAEKQSKQSSMIQTGQPGTTLAVNIHGAAPKDAEVSLRLIDENGNDLTAPVIASVQQGQSLDSLRIEIPADAEMGSATLAMFVGDRQQITWKVQITE